MTIKVILLIVGLVSLVNAEEKKIVGLDISKPAGYEKVFSCEKDADCKVIAGTCGEAVAINASKEGVYRSYIKKLTGAFFYSCGGQPDDISKFRAECSNKKCEASK